MFRSIIIPFLIFILLKTITVIVWYKLPKILISGDGVETVELTLINQFGEYVRKYNKSYGDAEYLRRQRYFGESIKEASRLNELHGSTVFGLNKFSDWSPEETSSLVSPVPQSECQEMGQSNCSREGKGWNHTVVYTYDTSDITRKFKIDWRDEGVIGEIIDQKLCSGCWAMSIVGVMESMWAIQKNPFYSLSIQELIDCSTYNSKCEGGNVNTALQFLCSFDYPIVDSASYPLRLINEECTMPEPQPSGRRIAKFTAECYIDERRLLWLIANHGPVVAVVNARPWFYYVSGVIQRACDGKWGNLQHAIQIVGYDLTAEVPYYIVKNSWGTSFGEAGYLKVAVGGNVCGIASSVAYFNVK